MADPSERMPTRKEAVVRPPLAKPAAKPAAPRPAAVAVDDDAAAYRPVRRAPLVLLTVLDDGRDDGEIIRVRTEQFVIGRNQGDLTIPFDGLISSPHAELARETSQGQSRWYLTDRDSRNGTYVKIDGPLTLKSEQELLLGGGRYRFRLPGVADDAGGAGDGATRGWQTVSADDLYPHLIEVTPAGEGQKYPLADEDHWFGRDSIRSDLVKADDPLLSRRHAHFFKADAGWQVQCGGGRNGVWLRVDRVRLGNRAHFQLGEQRFLVRVLS